MTDTNKCNANTITHQTPDELSEQDMQAVNGGGKVGNPQQMLDEILAHPSPSSSGSYGLRQMHGEHEAPPEQSGGILKKLTDPKAKVFGAHVGFGALRS